jgi:hypothetical protein
MARREVDREDLMREATALCERVEMRYGDEPEPVVAGFSRDGRLSLYFGSEPVYHFDPQGRLRRAYSGGNLYRSQGTTLARLTRVRAERATDLERHDLAQPELQLFLLQMRNRVQSLADALRSKRGQTLRRVPGNADVETRLIDLLPAIARGTLAPALRK